MDASVEQRPYQTLAEFQQAHERLLDLFNAQESLQENGEGAGTGSPGDADDDDAARYCLIEMLDPLRGFLSLGAAGGAYLHEARERRAAQALLDYWASQCYGANLDIPRPMLLPHDPALLPSLLNEACPYVGLEAFDETRARHFFGRKERIDALVRRLDEGRLVVVTGASGSGKSSLVLAGVLPALRADAVEGSAGWRYLPPLVPGAAPLEHLVQALAGALQPSRSAAELTAWQAAQVQRLQADPAQLAAMLGAEGRPCVLVVDQFEETMTLRTEANAPAFAAFVAALQSVVEVAAPPHRLLLTMRNDVDTRLAREYPELNRRYSSAAFPLSSMDSTQLRDAIEAPAAQVGLKFQEGVVDDLIRSVVGEEAGLPLLQYNLIALWERRRGNLITLEAHQAVGNPRQAMAEAARRLHAELPSDQQLATGRVFLALTRQGDGAAVFRNRMTRRQLHEVAEPNTADRVLEKFERARLLRVSRPNAAEPLDDIVEVAHEALLRHWDLLQRLFSERRDERERRAFLRKQAQTWREAGFDPAFLLGGLALQQAVQESQREALGELEQDFIHKSTAAETLAEAARAEEAQRREQLQVDRLALAQRGEAAAKRVANQLRVSALVAGGVLLVAALLAWWGWNQAARLSAQRVSEAQFEKEAVQRNAKAEKEEIVDRARREAQRIEAKARDAEDHAADVIFKAGLDRLAANLDLRRAEQQQASLQRDLARARADRLMAKASSSATTDSDLSLFYAKEAVLLDPALLMPLTPTLLEASRFRRAYARLPFDALGAVDALALSADGQRMLSANGKELSEWRLAPGGGADLQHRLAWPKPPGDVNALAFAPDGRSAAVGTDEGVWLWQTGAGPALLPLEPKLAAKRVKIGSDGQVVVALSNDGRRAAAWSVRDRRQLLSYELPEKDPSLFDVLFSETGGRLVLVAAPGAADLGARTLVFERTADGFAKAPQVATGPSCKDAGYSYAAGGSQLGVVLAPQLCLHDLRRLGETQAAPSMSEETSVVEDIVFSPDGRYLVKLMRRSNEAQLVDLRGGATLRLQGAFDLPPSTSYEPLLSVSTGGERLAIKGNDGSVRLFDLGASANSLSESGGAVWLSANDEVAVVRTYTDAEAGIEARAMRSNAVLRPLGGKGRYADPRDFVLDADGRSLHFRADCGPAPERGEAPRCIVSQDLRSPAAAPHEQPYTNHLARAETLYLLTDERQWLVYSAAAQAVVFRADPPGTSPKARPRDAASAGIELGNGRSFAVKRTVGGMLKVDVYAVEAGAARLVRSIERPAGSGYTVGFRGQGRALLLASAARSELWDLRSPSNAPAVVVEGRSAGEALVNAETGLVALQAASGPWELRSLEDGRPRGSLPAQFQIEPGAAYAWAQMNGRWQVRALAEPAAVRLEGEGEVSDAQFSRTGGVMAVILQGGGRLRVYTLQTRKPLFETETAMLPGAQLSDAGGYLRDQEGRLVPADSAALLASVQTPSRRTWDGDRERCRLLNDAPACGRAALRPAPVSVP